LCPEKGGKIILYRQGNEVITRNSYGAKCLNTPDVLIADVDTTNQATLRLTLALAVLLFFAVCFTSWQLDHVRAGIILGLAAALFANLLANNLLKIYQTLAGGPLELLRKKLNKFFSQNPTWNIRLYRTPAGFRLIVTQQNFHPSDAQVHNFFTRIGADPLYTKMCQRQACFRARLSAKPWRIGLNNRLKPRPGVWPVAQERLAERRRWIEHYDRQAVNFAACCFIASMGSGVVTEPIAAVIKLHDVESKALVDGLPLA
jgi:hypothetical protein